MKLNDPYVKILGLLILFALILLIIIQSTQPTKLVTQTEVETRYVPVPVRRAVRRVY